MRIELGGVIAERRFHVLGRPDLDIRLRLGMPRAFDDGRGDFYCPYQIVGFGSDAVRYVGGVDGLHALELAIRCLPTELESLRLALPGLRWEDATDGLLGFASQP